jgi:cytochrome c-type biogenesis protein CcmH
VKNRLITCLFLLIATAPALAGEAASRAADVALEKRVMAISEELRCLVCQNQTIADSNAPLAIDLKDEVRAKLAAGMSEREIINFMVARYGDFVLYRPPVKITTMLLWFGPPLLLVLALWLFLRTIQRRRAGVVAAPLSAAEQARAAQLLNIKEGDRP